MTANRSTARPPRRATRLVVGPAAVLAGLLLAAALVPVAPAAAQGDQSLGVTPPAHLVEGAIEGESYRRQVTVQNEFDSTTTVTLNASGEVGQWTMTEPVSGFEVPPRTHEDVDLTIRVPEDAVNGTYEGKLHVTAEAKGSPDGSGAAIRYSVAVLLTVQVGGEPEYDLQYGGGGGSDVEEGSPPDVEATVTNGGNVRDTAEACALVYPLDGSEAVAQARAETRVLPGEQTTLDFPFEEPLPQGQYRLEILPRCEETKEEPIELASSGTFKVVPPGTLGKDGMLRYIEHPPEAQAGQPLRIDAVFANVGEADIARATGTVEVYKDGELVEVLKGEPLLVPQDEEVELTSYFTPEEPGRYTFRGVVTYDGFESEQRESFVQVASPASDGGWQGLVTTIAPILGLSILVGLVAYEVRRRRRSTDGTEGLAEAEIEELH